MQRSLANHSFTILAVLLLGFSVLVCASADAAPGNLDATFGRGGKVTTSFGPGPDEAHGVAVQRDGKIVAAGYSNNGTDYDFALARYKPDGSLDPSFGKAGKVTTGIGPGNDYAEALALQPDGKIIVAGLSSTAISEFPPARHEVALARYKPNGSLDSSFGSGGMVTTAIGASSGASAVALQPNGKIIVAGSSDRGGNADFALARYWPDGSLDSSFGSGGEVTTAIGPMSSFASAIALQRDGKIVAGGGTERPDFNYSFALARYTASGSLDPTFGAAGKVTTSIGITGSVGGLALQPDAKIVAAGTSDRGENTDFALARYRPDGSLDPSFGMGGKVATSISPRDDFAHAVALEPGGKVVVVGESYAQGANRRFAVARYRRNGRLDASFGARGNVTTHIHGTSDSAVAVAIQRDGKIIAAGYTAGMNYTADSDFALVRYVAAPVANCRVPDVRGKWLATAERAIVRAHCSLGRVKRVFSSRLENGRVISQRPKPGTRLPARARVQLVVSKGMRRS